MSPPRTEDRPSALPRDARRIGLLLAFGGLLVVLDATITAVAVPAMVAGLRAPLSVVQWVTTGYLLGIVAVIPLAGRLTARFGARRVYVTALLVFTVFSALAGLAWSAPSLAVFRALQGAGGGLLNPVGQAIAFRAAPPNLRGRLMSLLGLPLFIGPVAGPLLGGWLVAAASWRWIFLVNVPLGLLAAALAARHLPPPENPGGERTGGGRAGADWAGVLLVPGGAALTVYGCMAEPAALPFGLALLAAFVVRAKKIEAPLVDVRLLRYPAMRSGLIVLAGFGGGYFGAVTLLPIVVQGARGLPATTSGLIALPGAPAIGVTVTVATRLVDRLPARRIILAGVSAGLLGAGLLGAANVTGAPLGLLVLGAVVLAAGSGATLMPAMTMTLRDLPGGETAAGATLMALVQQLAAALGVALVTAAIGMTTRSAGGGVGLAEGGGRVGWAYSIAMVLMVCALWPLVRPGATRRVSP